MKVFVVSEIVMSMGEPVSLLFGVFSSYKLAQEACKFQQFDEYEIEETTIDQYISPT